MQVLWSRAAQARSSCRCSSCLHTATTVARQTTGAVSKRRIRAGDIFTACYSTILATAAIADSKVKDERRKEWDRLIAEAKAGTPTYEPDSQESVDTGTVDGNSRFSFLPESTVEQSRILLGKYKPSSSPLVWNGDNWMLPPAAQETSLGIKLRTLDSKLQHSDVEKEWVDEMSDSELPSREPRKQVHLEKLQEQIAGLVDRFLAECNIFSIHDKVGAPDNDVQMQLKEMARRIEQLQRGFTKLPAYSWKKIEVIRDQRDSLHRSLNALCRKATSDRPSIDLMLAKICYNLLISTAPPSRTTYHILLAELNRLQQHDLTQIVVDSFFNDTRFMPSQMTVRLILQHYIAKNDPIGFQAIINRMRSTDGDMRIKKRGLVYLKFPKDQEWALTSKVIHRNGDLRQKTPRDTETFNTLILGSLKLKGVRDAVRQVRCAYREGQRVHYETLCSVIRACLAQVDFGAGLGLLRHILSMWEDGTGSSVIAYAKELRYLLYRLLDMCGFKHSLNSGQGLPIKASQEAFENMLRHMHFMSISDAVERSAKLISSLENALDLHRSQEAATLASKDLRYLPRPRFTKNVTSALRILAKVAGTERLRTTRREVAEADSRQRRLQVLKETITTRGQHIASMEVEVLKLLCGRLTDRQRVACDKILTGSEKGTLAMSTSSKLDIISQLASGTEPILGVISSSGKNSSYLATGFVIPPSNIKQKATKPSDPEARPRPLPPSKVSARPRATFPNPLLSLVTIPQETELQRAAG